MCSAVCVCVCVDGINLYVLCCVCVYGMNLYVLCCVCVCMCVDGMNLYALCWHIHISVQAVLCQCYLYTSTHASSNHLRTVN